MQFRASRSLDVFQTPHRGGSLAAAVERMRAFQDKPLAGDRAL